MSEITTPEWRTTFGGGLSAAYMVGMVSVFIIGKVGRDHVEVKKMTRLMIKCYKIS